MRDAIILVWKFSLLAEAAVAVRLLVQGLAGQYPALMTAMCILPLKSLMLMESLFSKTTVLQVRALNKFLLPVEWVLYAWIVFELFSLWSKSYVGIGRFGKFLLAALLAGALLLSLLFGFAEWKALVFSHDFRVYYMMDRVIWGTLALFVLGIWQFFRKYPVSIAPNVVRHTHIAVVYFVVGAICLLLFTLNGVKVVAWANIAIVISSASCYCAWAVLLTRRGQVLTPMQQISQQDKERIERINKELLVFMREVPKNGR